MTLVKEGLWGIVKATETFPEGVTDEAQPRFQARMDITVYKAFSTSAFKRTFPVVSDW